MAESQSFLNFAFLPHGECGVSLSGGSRSFRRSSWHSLDWVRGVSARGLRNWSILTSFFLS
ncbi:hypothetical protein EFR98_00770 [Lentilactobacillus buchneri]|nr:hypothetical protein [Lentilactobacillus buchneri]